MIAVINEFCKPFEWGRNTASAMPK